LRQVEDLAGIVAVAGPDRGQVARGVADRVAHEEVQAELVAERELQGGLDDRAEIGSEARLRSRCLQPGAADLDGQEPGGMGELLGEVDLEVAEHLSAVFAPARDGGMVRILDDLLRQREDRIEILALPGIEDRL